MPAERTSGRLRARLPKVKAGGSVKADLSNHPFRRDCAEPSSLALRPVLFGREPPPKEFVRFTALVNGKGFPDWKTLPPLIPHPETSLPHTTLALDRNRLPLP